MRKIPGWKISEKQIERRIVMNSYLIFSLGIIIGSIMTRLILQVSSAKAVLRIDHSNPEKDIYRLDLDNVCNMNKKTLLLKIDHHANFTNKNSQK